MEELALAVRLSFGVLRKTKPELIEAMKKMDRDARLDADAPERLLEGFVRGRDLAERFQRLINSAECRTAIAIANIC
jgi:hypothetical protein